MRQLRLFTIMAVASALIVPAWAQAAPAPAPYFNGFENAGDAQIDPAYTSNDAFFDVTRVASGTGGVTSASGAWHAVAGPTFFGPTLPFTRYGGYSSVFPAGGYTTSVDVYLDTAASPAGSDIRFDWSSAISTPAGSHRRDFVFSGGTDGSGGFAISASNNSPGWPANPGRDPLFLATSGWYTLEHSFRDTGGVLAVDMTVRDASGTALKTWTLSDPTDLIGVTVGGNRYGWLVTNGFATLALDNVRRSGAVAMSKDDCKNGGWQHMFRADGSSFKNQGDCIQYVNTGK